jgi:hypothetical protein
MNDLADLVLGDEAGDQWLVAGVADDERHALGNGPVEAGGEIVQHHHALPRVSEGMDHVASDVSGAAGNEDRHYAGSALPQVSRGG